MKHALLRALHLRKATAGSVRFGVGRAELDGGRSGSRRAWRGQHLAVDDCSSRIQRRRFGCSAMTSSFHPVRSKHRLHRVAAWLRHGITENMIYRRKRRGDSLYLRTVVRRVTAANFAAAFLYTFLLTCSNLSGQGVASASRPRM